AGGEVCNIRSWRRTLRHLDGDCRPLGADMLYEEATIMAQSTIIELDEVEPRAGYCGAVYELIKPHNSGAERLSCVFVEVAPGARSRPHRHITCEEIYFVVSGTGVVYLGSQTQAVSSGYVIHIPPGVRHMVENDSAMPLRLFVVNAPPYQADDVIFEEDES
ncbi:MAG: cupin domain-containing protein, partial [Anaerolineae bacterium]